MSNQQEVGIASPVHTASETRNNDIEPTGSQPPVRQVEEDPNLKRAATNSPTTSSGDRNESKEDPKRKRAAADSPTTSSENGNEPKEVQRIPQRRIPLPDCARCKKPPVEPHAVYCCGSMYCHTCLVSKMAAAANEGGIVTCDKCKKPMGESPTKQKNSQAKRTAELYQPPAKIRRTVSQPQLQGNTMVMSDGGYSPLTVAAPTRIPITASAPVAGNQPFLVAQRTFGSAPPYTFSRTPLNIPTSQSHPMHTNFTPAGSPNPLMVRPRNTRQVLQSTQTPSLPPQTSSMGPIPTQSVVNLPSIPPRNSFPSTPGTNSLMQPTPNLIQNTQRVLPPPTKPILVGGTCTICWEGSKIPVQINCCSRIFCRECLVTSMNVRPRCPSCNRVYAPKDISQSYVEMTIPEPVEAHPVLESTEKPNNVTQNRIDATQDFSKGRKKYRKLTKVANLNLYRDPSSTNSISSLEFNTTGEHFAVAGINRNIKIFDFDHFFQNQTKEHIPLALLSCQAPVSGISWNPNKNESLASSDYAGHISLWDVEAERVVKSFHAHEKSCWTVNFNNVDSQLMASGSDDSIVKIWDINCARSIIDIRTEFGASSVCFHPNERNKLIFGSENRRVYLYDIRYANKPWTVFHGHIKAVSHVRFLSNTTIVSASADSSLRVWDTVEGRCLEVLKGHTNEKNFVGLSSNGDHILCGSENGRVFLYSKGVSEPIASHVLGENGSTNNGVGEGFVTSVCWKKGTNYALAANSHGRVHLFEAK